MPYRFKSAENDISIRLGGTIDRVDCKQDNIIVADYKTGGGEKQEGNVTLDDIFIHKIKSSSYRLQAFMYSIALKDALENNRNGHGRWIEKIRQTGARKISPQLLYVHRKENATRNEFVVNLSKTPIDDITSIENEYMSRLQQVLSEIFDVNIPFAPTSDCKRCEFCDYKEICGK
jgi:ATP-dependent helicase/DNAse subunit B